MIADSLVVFLYNMTNQNKNKLVCVSIFVPGIILIAEACTMTTATGNASGPGYSHSEISGDNDFSTQAKYLHTTQRWLAGQNQYRLCSGAGATTDYEFIYHTSMQRSGTWNVETYEYATSTVFTSSTLYAESYCTSL